MYDAFSKRLSVWTQASFLMVMNHGTEVRMHHVHGRISVFSNNN